MDERCVIKDTVLDEITRFIETQSIDTDDAGWRTGLPKPPLFNFDPERKYYWELQTNLGHIIIRLMPDTAPMHVSSTIYLILLGFYDNLVFHRVISDFMAQGGCPLGSGTGGPGYVYDGEFGAGIRHDKPGLLSMANAGPGTDGSQFFLTFVATPWLDGKHTIFGEVIGGFDIVRALEQRGSQSGKPSEDLAMMKSKVRVEQNAS